MHIGLLILLLMLGVIFVVAEVFFVSFGVLAILAASCFVSSIFLAYTQHSQEVGHVLLGTTAVVVPLSVWFALKWLPHTKIGQMMILPVPDRGATEHAAEEPGLGQLSGKHGLTESTLRPSGIARIDGRRVHVVTRGELLDSGVAVEVIQVDGNRVVVRERPAP